MSSGGMARHERLRRILARPDCYFVGDLSRRFYHNKDCSYIEKITKRNLEACGANPELHGFKPCPFCKPTPVIKKKDDAAGLKAKSEVMRQALAELANRHGMHAAFKDGTALVTTVAGEWIFNFNQRPIQLFHKNSEDRLYEDSRPSGDYHSQYLTFPSPMDALVYIYHHERAAEARAFAEPKRAHLTKHRRG